MESQTTGTTKRRGRPRTNEKFNEAPQTNFSVTKERSQLPANINISSIAKEELDEIMEAEFGSRYRETLIVIYDKVELTLRSVHVKKPFNQIGKGLRAMRLSIVKKKMNENEVIVNEELILAIEFKKG